MFAGLRNAETRFALGRTRKTDAESINSHGIKAQKRSLRSLKQNPRECDLKQTEYGFIGISLRHSALSPKTPEVGYFDL